MLRVVITCVLVALVAADPVPDFKDCGSTSGKITSLDITPCPQFPCGLPKGKNISVSIGITANKQITSATTVVHGIIANVPVPFPIPNADACKSMTCPVASGAEVTYNNVIFVEEAYPTIRLVVKWEIKDQDGDDFVCFEIPAEVTN